MNKMTVDEIIQKDVSKNWKDSGLSPQQAYAIINRKIENGNKIFRYKDILIIYAPMDDQTIEYHAVNGGMSWDELDKAVLAFAITMRDRGVKFLATFFNDAKLKKGFEKQKVFPVEFQEVDDPRGKFMAIARLS